APPAPPAAAATGTAAVPGPRAARSTVAPRSCGHPPGDDGADAFGRAVVPGDSDAPCAPASHAAATAASASAVATTRTGDGTRRDSSVSAVSTTLAERLGHAPNAKLVVVTCDDLGSTHAANVAVYEALRHGVATSASLMVPCPWARDAAAQYRGEDVGVHLTLNSEWDTYRWGPI